MGITVDNIYSNVNGYVISHFDYLNNGKIFKVYTDELGLISIYSKSIETFFSLYSKYNFKLIRGDSFFYCDEFELLEYNFFKNKNYILFLNLITEIILNSSFSEIKNIEIFSLISNVLNHYKKFKYEFLLSYFVFNYLKFSGYHLFIENKISKKYIINILDLEIINFNYSILDYKFNYIIDCNEYKLFKDLNTLNNLSSFINFHYFVNYKRILGILINALCLNFNILKLNTFGLFE